MARPTNFQNSRSQGYIPSTSARVARFPLSSAPTGVTQAVSTSAGSPTLVHTFSTDISAIEELYLYASNYGATDADLTMSIATSIGTAFTGGNQIITPTVKEGGLTLFYPGIPHQAQGNALNVYVLAAGAATLNVGGYVVRYYPIDWENSARSGFYSE
tara:strand:- start:8790 stop:9263 length:474 start_codon:yes stop_codon:yes gene_type:complete